jgi:hypothetical protein
VNKTNFLNIIKVLPILNVSGSLTPNRSLVQGSAARLLGIGRWSWSRPCEPLYTEKVTEIRTRVGRLAYKTASGWPGVTSTARADHVFPLTPIELDIWRAHESGRFGVQWRMDPLVRIEGTSKLDMHKWSIRHVVREAEPLTPAFLEVHGSVLRKAVDNPDAELACDNFVGSQDHAQEAESSTQRRRMPLSRPLPKFGLYPRRLEKLQLFVLCHCIVVYGVVLALVSANVSGASSAREGCTDFGDDQAYWPDHRLVLAGGGVNRNGVLHRLWGSLSWSPGLMNCCRRGGWVECG